VRKAALRTLALLSDEACWRVVLDAASSDPSPRLRAWLRRYVASLHEHGGYANSLEAYAAGAADFERLSEERCRQISALP
jgi:hypothetical protein